MFSILLVLLVLEVTGMPIWPRSTMASAMLCCQVGRLVAQRCDDRTWPLRRTKRRRGRERRALLVSLSSHPSM